eukprot:m.376872 g.376872  ORF g.376872 m.376872 type:complete len:229 (+) comp16702_c0_seq20:2489-3175(+)
MTFYCDRNTQFLWRNGQAVEPRISRVMRISADVLGLPKEVLEVQPHGLTCLRKRLKSVTDKQTTRSTIEYRSTFNNNRTRRRQEGDDILRARPGYYVPHSECEEGVYLGNGKGAEAEARAKRLANEFVVTDAPPRSRATSTRGRPRAPQDRTLDGWSKPDLQAKVKELMAKAGLTPRQAIPGWVDPSKNGTCSYQSKPYFHSKIVRLEELINEGVGPAPMDEDEGARS